MAGQPLIAFNDFVMAQSSTLDARKIQHNIEAWLVVAKKALAENTLKAYKADWAIFSHWCESRSITVGHPVPALPATVDTIMAFIDDTIGRRAPASIKRCLSTVSKLHDVADVKNPLKHPLIETAKKAIGTGLKHQKRTQYESHQMKALGKTLSDETRQKAPSVQVGVDVYHHNLSGLQAQATPLTRTHLRELQKQLPVMALIKTPLLPTIEAKSARRHNAIQLKRARDLALVHLAYDSTLRVSELSRVRLEDFAWAVDHSATITIGQRKDSRSAQRAEAYITRESGAMIKRWIEMAGLSAGPLLRGLTKGGQLRVNAQGYATALTTKAIWEVYQCLSDVLEVKGKSLSCHSTRVGAAHDMHEANINMPLIKQAGRWKSDIMPTRYGLKSNAKKGAMAIMERNDEPQ